MQLSYNLVMNLLAINIQEDFAPAQKFNDIGSVVSLITTNLFLLAGIILFIGIILGGFKLMTGGTSDQLESGKKTLTYSAIGFILIFVSYFLVQVIYKVLGMQSIL